MMEWWNDIRMLCARYLVASEQMERSGPVAAAVRAVGYTSEGEDEEDESEEGGSSIEDEAEQDHDIDDEEYVQAAHADAAAAGIGGGATVGGQAGAGVDGDSLPPQYHSNGHTAPIADGEGGGYPVRQP